MRSDANGGVINMKLYICNAHKVCEYQNISHCEYSRAFKLKCMGQSLSDINYGFCHPFRRSNNKYENDHETQANMVDAGEILITDKREFIETYWKERYE